MQGRTRGNQPDAPRVVASNLPRLCRGVMVPAPACTMGLGIYLNEPTPSRRGEPALKCPIEGQASALCGAPSESEQVTRE